VNTKYTHPELAIIDEVGRLAVAQRVEMTYSSLTAKMLGYVAWQEGEMTAALGAAETIKKESLL